MKAVTLATAKKQLAKLADRTLRSGKPIRIRRGARILELREAARIEPIEHFAVGDLPPGKTAIALEKLHGSEVGGPDAS
jgi:hypothetical protein